MHWLSPPPLFEWLLGFPGRPRLVELQREFRDPRCDVEAVLALDRDRLKRDRFLESTNQDVGACANAERLA